MSSAGAADAGSSRWRIRAISAFIGLTTRKNTAAAMVTNVITACRNAPYRKSALLIEKCRSTSPDSPANIEISGETKAVTNVWTSCVNAVPITDRDRQLEHVAPQDEVAELLQHAGDLRTADILA